MRSEYADYFNHDGDAPEYDGDVRNEGNPIRTGYSRVLTCIGSRIKPGSRVLDLGTGTGNTILRLPADAVVTGVDVSERMLALAEAKLAGRAVTLVRDDILAFVTERELAGYDAVVSSYALHHLTALEREHLFRTLREKTDGGTRVIAGDLMYRNEEDRLRILAANRDSCPGLADDMEDEFFWNVEESTKMLHRSGWTAQWKRFSDLSWVVVCDKGARP